jgi:hypothetical protein
MCGERQDVAAARQVDSLRRSWGTGKQHLPPPLGKGEVEAPKQVRCCLCVGATPPHAQAPAGTLHEACRLRPQGPSHLKPNGPEEPLALGTGARRRCDFGRPSQGCGVHFPQWF